MFNIDKQDLTAASDDLTGIIDQLTAAVEIRDFQPKADYLEKEYGPNYIEYTKHCNLCGREYKAIRVHAFFCSSACRTRMHREKRKAIAFIDKYLWPVLLICILFLLADHLEKTLQKRSDLSGG